jgi:hypothetical protein
MARRRNNVSLPLLVSFNELAWIAVFALLMLYSIASVRSQKEIARLQLNRCGPDKKVINQRLVDLQGDLKHVVFVVDRSGSMNVGRRWEFARGVIRTWLEHLSIEQCALVTFNDSVSLFPARGTYMDMAGPAGDENRAALLDQFTRITPAGNTNTLAALEAAYAYPQLDTIILFTDGVPDRGSNTFDQQMANDVYALCRAHGRRVPINVVGLGDYFNPQFGEFLLRLSRETGGTFIGR